MSNVVNLATYIKSRMPETDQVQRKLAAILAADIAGYSRLTTVDEQGTVQRLGQLLAVVEDRISRRGGRVVSTAGDGILAEFASAMESVFAAIEIQQAAAAFNANLDKGLAMQFRIGVSIGDVIQTGEDIHGDSVNVAARLQQIAEPGAIYVTRTVRDHLRDKTMIQFDDLGERDLKNLPRPVRTFRVSLDELPDIPSPSAASDGGDEEDEEEASTTELAFWQSVDDSASPGDYEAYLEKYPNGAFAELARTRLEDLARTAPEPSPEETQIELAFWDSIKDQADVKLFEAYLKKYPNGHFADIAKLKIK
jgi:class 3 adenylate cyclase